MRKSSTTEEFIRKAISKHGDKYDYSKVKYINAKTKICIICPTHGEFCQKPNDHLNGCGCQKCADAARKKCNKKTKTTEEFISECEKKYGDRYDLSSISYNGCNVPITIFDKVKNCSISITPTALLSKELSTHTKVTKNNFINKAKEIFGDAYIYDNTEYVDSMTKIKYICQKHGEIEQLPLNHLRYGCRYCSKEKSSLKQCLSINDFIKRAREIHGYKYDYSKVNYVNSSTKICIICHKHGEFFQTPSKHLCGHGCHKCNRSHLEEEMSLFLEKNNIKYIEQYAPSFLKNGKGLQKIDFYLPKYNVAIDCQGLQHFINNFYIKGNKCASTIDRDRMKYNKCIDNGIKLFYYTTYENFLLKDSCDIYNENNIFFDKEKMMSNILIK